PTSSDHHAPWSDVVLLATCNRVEVYVLTKSPNLVSHRMRKSLGVSSNDQSLYVLDAEDAAAHLIRVASGLDSVAEGEQQVTEQMARIAAQALRGRARVEILNRDVARARQLAKILNGEAVPLRKLSQVLAEADVVVAATASQAPLVTARGLRAAMHRRDGRPI